MIKADVVCTVWRKTEVNRIATWTQFACKCHWEPIIGETRSVDGELAEDNILCIVFNDEEIRNNDKLSFGASSATEPPSDCHDVTRVERFTFNGKYHHTEVHAK